MGWIGERCRGNSKKFIEKRRRKRRFRKGRWKVGGRVIVRWRLKNGWKNYEGKKNQEIKIDY